MQPTPTSGEPVGSDRPSLKTLDHFTEFLMELGNDRGEEVNRDAEARDDGLRSTNVEINLKVIPSQSVSHSRTFKGQGSGVTEEGVWRIGDRVPNGPARPMIEQRVTTAVVQRCSSRRLKALPKPGPGLPPDPWRPSPPPPPLAHSHPAISPFILLPARPGTPRVYFSRAAQEVRPLETKSRGANLTLILRSLNQ